MRTYSPRLSLPATFLRAFAIACTLLFLFPRHAQSQIHPTVSFEVASIRPVAGGESGGEGGSRSQIETAADGLTMRNIDLSEMIQWAYKLQHYQLTGPSSLAGPRYDIHAKSGDRVSDSTLRLMLQDLLVTRFKLQLHREQKTTSVYELVVAKGGPRLPDGQVGHPSSLLSEGIVSARCRRRLRLSKRVPWRLCAATD